VVRECCRRVSGPGRSSAIAQSIHQTWPAESMNAHPNPASNHLSLARSTRALEQRCLGNLKLVERLLRASSSGFPRKVAQIEESLQANDTPKTCPHRHQLKGAAANLSAISLQRSFIESRSPDELAAWTRFLTPRGTLPRVDRFIKSEQRPARRRRTSLDRTGVNSTFRRTSPCAS